MPKTPPLIIPNSIPNDWINRSKISKSNTKVKNIFAPQNKKQLRFEDTEELQFADNYQPSSEIGLNDFLQQNEHQDASSPQVAASDIFYFTSLNQQNNLSQSSFKHSQQDQNNNKNMSQQRYMKTDTVVEEQDKQQKLNIIEQASQKDQMILQTNENFNSTLTDMSSEFQQFMEEHRQIKKSIEDKRQELEQFTKERMLYLDERQTYFQSRMKSLKDFYY